MEYLCSLNQVEAVGYTHLDKRDHNFPEALLWAVRVEAAEVAAWLAQ